MRETHIRLSCSFNFKPVLYPGRIRILSFWCLVGGKPENREKNPRSKARINNQLKPHMALAQNRTRVTLVVGERYHHCHTPAPQQVTGVRSLQENLRPRPWCIDRGIARSTHQGRGLRFPCNDRTNEVNKLFIIWPFLALFLKRTQ